MGTEQHLSCADSPGTHHLGLGGGYLKKVRLEIISHSLGCYWWKLRARLSSGGDRSLVLEAVKLIRHCHCQLSLHTFQFSFPRVKSASFTKIHSCTEKRNLIVLTEEWPTAFNPCWQYRRERFCTSCLVPALYRTRKTSLIGPKTV